MKTTYSYEQLLKFDDPFEYEVGLPLKIDDLPSSVIEEDIPDSRATLLKKLTEGYSLIIQKPRIPNEKVFAALPLLDENEFMKLYEVNETAFTEELWKLLYENEYVDGWSFLLLKDTNRVVFELSHTRNDTHYLRLAQLKANVLLHLRLELNEMVTCLWK
ncbi:MAG TPA: hypothetical protein DIS82_14260 [Exiguobacterium sp.]|uniref:hypothetical protein n=1 Tax=Exiguobacterium sp. TaxID=44751 RepID=UPI000EEB6025|nr:hypothetical protein [Exiguobacterium sp.]HCN59315.1 hypothetical protein [Exiguobacterium sp.]